MCAQCANFTYSTIGEICVDCAVPSVLDAITRATMCRKCEPGQEPNTTRTGCDECTPGSFSTRGAECLPCPSPLIVSSDMTSCAPPYNCPVGNECTTPPCMNDNDCSRCDVGNVSIGSTDCTGCTDLGKVANEDQSQCIQCDPGQQPAENRSRCVFCRGNTFSKFGIECEPCRRGTAVNVDHTHCNQIVQGQAVTDAAVLDEILDGTEFLRPTVSLEFEVSDSVFVTGSEAQALFFKTVVADIAAALGINATDMAVLGIANAFGNGRRRIQSSSAAHIQFEIAPAVASIAMAQSWAQLSAQLADPESPLRQSPGLASINPNVAPIFNLACPAGKFLPGGASDCEKCPAGKRLIDGSCQDCVAALGQVPNEVGDDCTCMLGFYNSTTRGALGGGIKCYSTGYTGPATSAYECQSCAGMECISSCEGDVAIAAGWSALRQPDNGTAESVFKCSSKSACPGGPGALDPLDPQGTRCSPGHDGRICGSCDDTHARTGNGCVSCENITGLGMVARLFVALIVVGIGVLIMKAISGRVEVASEVLKQGAPPHKALLPQLSTRTQVD